MIHRQPDSRYNPTRKVVGTVWKISRCAKQINYVKSNTQYRFTWALTHSPLVIYQSGTFRLTAYLSVGPGPTP